MIAGVSMRKSTRNHPLSSFRSSSAARKSARKLSHISDLVAPASGRRSRGLPVPASQRLSNHGAERFNDVLHLFLRQLREHRQGHNSFRRSFSMRELSLL